MQQLSGQDASFLYLETPDAPMHIGAITLYDQRTVPGGVQGFKAILAAIEARLHLARTFRQRVLPVPLGLDHPWWIEDAEFDLEFHVRHVALPKPGDWRQLCIQAARLHARPLDLSRPLWEFTIIEGLDRIDGLPPGSYAVVSKVHHAAIDGVSGVDITEALHDLIPEGAPVPVPQVQWMGEARPSSAALLSRAWWNGVRYPFRAADVAVRSVPALARLASGFLDSSLRGSGSVPRTRFNRAISPHRVVEGRIFDLDLLKRIRRSVEGATVNDVVLSLCGGALRRYLLAHDELPEVSLVAMAPISVRGGDERRSMGNRVAAMTASLGTHIPDPGQRLHYVTRSTLDSKARTEAIGARLMTDYTQFVPSTVAGLAARAYSRLSLANHHDPFFNCVVTNVPGPQVPLYSAGARMLTQFGLGPLFDGMGIIFPVFSYAGHLTISFTACRDMVTDPEFLAECLQAEFDDLCVASGITDAPTEFGAALGAATLKVEAIAQALPAAPQMGAPAMTAAAAPVSTPGAEPPAAAAAPQAPPMPAPSLVPAAPAMIAAAQPLAAAAQPASMAVEARAVAALEATAPLEVEAPGEKAAAGQDTKIGIEAEAEIEAPAAAGTDAAPLPAPTRAPAGAPQLRDPRLILGIQPPRRRRADVDAIGEDEDPIRKRSVRRGRLPFPRTLRPLLEVPYR